jgi:cytochrome oxidase Cu insertion factor (SCO1/SenC/PrrC family)
MTQLTCRSAAAGLFLVVLTLGLTAAAKAEEPKASIVAEHPWIGEPAPPIELPALDGTKVSLSQFRGKPVVIHFAATW